MISFQRLPEVNAGWIQESSRQFSGVDISVAVATDNGLITPIVKDAIGKGIQQVSQEVAVRSVFYSSLRTRPFYGFGRNLLTSR